MPVFLGSPHHCFIIELLLDFITDLLWLFCVTVYLLSSKTRFLMAVLFVLSFRCVFY